MTVHAIMHEQSCDVFVNRQLARLVATKNVGGL